MAAAVAKATISQEIMISPTQLLDEIGRLDERFLLDPATWSNGSGTSSPGLVTYCSKLCLPPDSRPPPSIPPGPPSVPSPGGE